jgi:predicted nucleic acid-binding protein
MKGLVTDTYYYLALLNPRDSAHPEAVAIGPTLAGRLVTTQYVLTEVADALSAPQDRAKFLALLVLLESDPSVTIVPGSNDLFRRGVALYQARPDKDWPLTDCISFIVMDDEGLTEALTADRHFSQAGFRTLLVNL